MSPLLSLLDFILHFDRHLSVIIDAYGPATYVILFIIVFCETGLVILPLLPGDSLLFVAGAFAAQGNLDIALLLGLLFVAAILGDTVNYWIGSVIGPRIFKQAHVRFLNKKYLEEAERFYEKHGGKTIIIARFMPIIRTFAPFVAGIGKMHYGRFLSYNLLGGLLWVAIFILGGFYFGAIPIIKENLTLAILIIIGLSVLPGVLKGVRRGV